MVFCNVVYRQEKVSKEDNHNPYFNRWFSAIPYSDYWNNKDCYHNPYFNRWFSAIKRPVERRNTFFESQSLF